MEFASCLQAIKRNMQKAVVGKDAVIDRLLIALICSGHVLVEDLPGLGKTTAVSALAASLGCSFQRIQFTPDVLPSDITGFNVVRLQSGDTVFHPGSVHNQIVLADEINRASPKTQAALLEAMQERQVTVDGMTYPLPQPFMVLATQNPVEMAGTYPLPEAQLDRFLMQIHMGYPTRAEELEILRSHRSVTDRVPLEPVADAADILEMQRTLPSIRVDEALMEYMVQVVETTRSTEGVALGVSPRGSIALMRASCGRAILAGRDYVLPEDIQELAPCVLAHRMVMKNRSGAPGTTAEDVVADILRSLRVPKVRG